jgi:2-oxo-hept-3-ene-1,7-dioate hydratase
MLSTDDIATAADQLFEAEQNRVQIRPLTLTYPDMDMDDAYAVQKAWVDRKIADGRRVTGYKIGLTSRAMQMAMKIDTPDFGILLDDMAYADGAQIRAADFTDPRIETEFAFVLNKPLSGEDVTVNDVLAATDYVVPALELIAARSYRVDPETGYTRNVCDTIADNAANAGYILSDTKVRPDEIDLCWAGAMLYLNGEIEETGLAGGVMGHPAHGIRWVCRRFARHGIGLEPGQVILAGSFTRPVAVSSGDTILADYGPLGTIEVEFV